MASSPWDNMLSPKKKAGKDAFYIITFLVVLGAMAVYMSPGESTAQTPGQQTTTQTETTANNAASSVQLCNSYANTGGLSCDKAVALATGTFPGTATSASLSTDQELGLGNPSGKLYWNVGIALSQPVNYFANEKPVTGDIQVIVDQESAKARLYKYNRG